jgi:hypothetical protein
LMGKLDKKSRLGERADHMSAAEKMVDEYRKLIRYEPFPDNVILHPGVWDRRDQPRR